MTDAREPSRPDPDALLADAEREGRGHLKIYLGMAPGVGKTFAMLEGARALKAQGVDVVIGLAETHGRKETAALLEGLEILPRRASHYRGQTLHEFDLDAALARKPKVLIVDEYAHTNIPDSRHPKRWLDIEELLRAGVDVHTTLNVQHLEGLSDVVARITGVRVRETVPDRLLEQADQVELIDLPPEDLTARLNEGKVYAGELAGRALENFFKPGNLSALRELALRRTAQRVDEQMVGYMRRHAIEGPWPTSERLMALVGPDGNGAMVVRATHRLAEQLKAPWIAVTVETPEQSVRPAGGVNEALTLALSLGGRTERLIDSDLPDAILGYARKNNVTQLVIGHARAGWLRDIMRRSLAQELVRKSQGIAVHVITGATRPARFPRLSPDWSSDWRTVATSVVAVALVILLTVVFPDLREPAVVGTLFLAAVLLSAMQGGVAASIFAAMLAFLAYNFFFTEPFYTFGVNNLQDILALFVFLIVAIVTGTLAGRTRDQAAAARNRMSALQSLYDFSRRLGGTADTTALLHAIVLQAHRLTERPTMLLQTEGGELAIRYAWPPEDALDTASEAAARWTLIHGEQAGRGTGTLPSATWHFLPLKTARGTVGVFGIALGPTGLPPERAQTLDAMLDLGAVALERVSLVADAARAGALAETERLRSALLSSISHDLRTPLTAILGSVTALRTTPDAFDKAARDDLLETIQEEAERLDRFVRNLLDMTRLESGGLDFKREWFAAGDVIDAVTRRFAKHVDDRRIVSIVHPNLPLVHADFVLLETTLYNLLDNAIKHAEGAAITVTALRKDTRICFEVRDDGPGIAKDDLPKLFDKFFRVHRGDKAVAGTGLGLAICKGLVEAMGGDISVSSPLANGRGVSFLACFPVEREPERIGAEAGADA